jgi:DNA-binding beta-propeller fold protein YncE
MHLYRTILLSLAAFAVNGFAQPYTITTIAGTDRLLDGKPANTVPLRDPWSVIADGGGGVYIADGLDNRIRRINAQGLMTTVAGTGLPGYSGDRGKATLASLDDPRTMVLDANLNLYIADYNNNVVRRISPDGTINTIAGNGSQLYTTDGQALRIGFSPGAIAVDSAGTTLYIGDDIAYRILKMDITSGKITAIAGTGVLAGLDSNDVGPGLICSVGIVTGMAVDSSAICFLPILRMPASAKSIPKGT